MHTTKQDCTRRDSGKGCEVSEAAAFCLPLQKSEADKIRVTSNNQRRNQRQLKLLKDSSGFQELSTQELEAWKSKLKSQNWSKQNTTTTETTDFRNQKRCRHTGTDRLLCLWIVAWAWCTGVDCGVSQCCQIRFVKGGFSMMIVAWIVVALSFKKNHSFPIRFQLNFHSSYFF